MRPLASVIVRTKDRVHTIGSTLAALRAQTVATEVVVVDSGSRDGTLEVARRWADRVVHVDPEDFTYGGALNLGAEAATCDVHMALSSHCTPRYSNWVEVSLSLYGRDDVAGTNQASHAPSGKPLEHTFHQTIDDVRTHPWWGFSNHASSWRAEAWRGHPFREDLAACEDKEWSWRVLRDGWTIAFDPRLEVPSTHRRDEGLVALWRRHHKEARALAELGALPWPTLSSVAREWWDLPTRAHSRYPRAVRLLKPSRLVQLHADAAGARTRHRVDSSLATAPGGGTA